VGNTINIKGKEYTKVVNRLKDFRDTFPANEGWAIKTEPISITNESVVFQATINNPDGVTVAVGHGHNILGADKALEKAETVAIGRAIGNFHPVYGGESDEFASAEEMQKWQENQTIVKDTGDGFPQTVQDNKVEEDIQKTEETNGELIWNFSGKNKGKKVSELDPNTCVWYLDNLDHLNAPENAHYKKALQAVVNGNS
tara:strand:+ start:143 stop:739 length:597 start_codon:yes stop_codon:yes gene_type:complete